MVNKNINPNIIYDVLINLNFDHSKQSFSGHLNGNYKIRTDKNFDIKALSFELKDSNLILNDLENSILFSEDKINVNILWNSKENFVKFNNLTIGSMSIESGKFDFKSETGFINLKVKKISLSTLKQILNQKKKMYSNLIDYEKVKYYTDNLKEGAFNDVNIIINFLFAKKFEVVQVLGSSNFSNVSVQYTNEDFKSFVNSISGNLKFDITLKKNQLINDQTFFELTAISSNGYLRSSLPFGKYSFSEAKITAKISKEILYISKLEFLQNKHIK